jgi:hypothetical protein
VVNTGHPRRAESGLASVDALIALAILAVVTTTYLAFAHGGAVTAADDVAMTIVAEVERAHELALHQNEPETVMLTPAANGTTLAVGSGVPGVDFTQTRTRSLSAPVSSSAVAVPADGVAIVALPSGAITIADPTALAGSSSAPACPANPTLTVGTLVLTVDCTGGALVMPSPSPSGGASPS